MCAVYVGQTVLTELRRIIEESEIIRCAAPRRRHLTASLTSTTITTTFSSTPFATALTTTALTATLATSTPARSVAAHRDPPPTATRSECA